MQAEWRETANQGRVLFLREGAREVAHLPGEERSEAISLWEGIAGYRPSSRIAGWRWRRGLDRLYRAIRKAVSKEELPIGEPA